ncbi:NADH-quinone oxidoreductase subunit N [Geodia barretti]|uniref:NADH:ubiquinone reductase (H(+)-translocating) n=1 Tax=Geodia barretti TaxID=519541 RepID=A0AA35X5L1_GEOBA|nr:NADH-quinone oxidoreductase subunit N [Geodia barretti]
MCVVVAGALLVVVAGMANLHRGVVTALGLAGVGAALAFTVLLWGELDGSWSLSSTVDGDSVTAFYGALQLDRFALFFKGLVTISAGLVLLASYAYTQRFAVRGPEFLITLYVALELSTLPLVALAAFSGGQRASEAGLKYLVLGAVASAVLLYGMALTFGYTGSTVLETMALSVGDAALDGSRPFGVQALVVGVVLMVAGFGFKVAAVPFHGWIPDVYEGAPTPVTAFLSVASKAAGFAVLMRVFFTAFEPLEVDWALLFAGIAAASMTFGNLAAIAQTNIKRMLAYSTIAHAGYLLVGLAAVASRTMDGVTIGPETVLFYLGGYAVTNLAAFFAVIAIADRTGSEGIPSFSGMGRRAPWLAAALAVALLSLTGIPLTVGFMAKLFVFGAAVKADLAWLVAVGALNSVVSAYYYLRVVRVMYLGDPSEGEQPARALPLDLSVAVTALAVVALGLWPQPLFRAAERAVERLF